MQAQDTPQWNESERKAMSELSWMESIDSALLNTLKRSASFVHTFSSLLRREFYPAPFVYRVWKDQKLPLFLDVVEHIQTLAFASESVVASCLKLDGNSAFILDPGCLAETKKARWRNLHLPFAIQLNLLTRELEEELSQSSLAFSSRQSDRNVVDRFRAARLRSNEILLLIETWAEVFDKNLIVRGDLPVRSFYTERGRKKVSDTVDQARRATQSTADYLVYCLHTRMAALTLAYEFALGMYRPDIAWHSVVNLHDEALTRCESIPQHRKDKLWQHSKESIQWRREILLGANSWLQPETAEQTPGLTVELFFKPNSDWVFNRCRIPTTFNLQVTNPPSDLLLAPANRVAPLVEIGVGEEIAATLREDRKLHIELPERSDDRHVLFGANLLALKYMGVLVEESQSAVTSNLTAQFQDIVHRSWSLAISESYNTNWRMKSALHLVESNFDKMYEAESHATLAAELADMLSFRELKHPIADFQGLSNFANSSHFQDHGFNDDTIVRAQEHWQAVSARNVAMIKG